VNSHGQQRPFDEWIGIEEAAAYLAIPVRTLYRLAQRGQLPASKVGRTWRFKRSQLDEHLAGVLTDPAPSPSAAAAGILVPAAASASPLAVPVSSPPAAEQRQLERLVVEQGGLLSELAGLADLSVRLSELSDEAAITGFVSQRLFEIFAVDLAGFVRLEHDSDGAVLTRGHGAGTLPIPAGFRIPVQDSALLRHVVEERLTVVLDDLPGQLTVAQDLIARLGVHSGIIAPVLDATEVWGVLALVTVLPRHFTPLETERIMAVAAQTGTAITNARLMAEAQRWAHQLEGIEALSRQLNRSRDVAGVGGAVAREFDGLLRYDGLRFYVLQPDGHTLEAVTLRANVEQYIDETPDNTRLQLGEGLGGTIALTRRAEMIPNVAADPRMQDIPGTPDVDESMIVVPLVYEDQVQGVLEISRLGLEAFEPSELRLAQILGRQAALALVNAHQVEELERRSERLERQLANQRQLLAITERLLKTRDHEGTLEAIADTLAEVVPHDTLTIYLVDQPNGQLVPVFARDEYAAQVLQARLGLGEGITGDVVARGEAELINDADRDPRVTHVPGTPEDEEESIIVAPLHSPTGVIGSLNLYRLEADFAPEELDLVKLFANHAAIALENAQVHQRLLVASRTDPLTGLGHHGAFQDALATTFGTGEPLSVLMVDLDDFKAFNDRHGHQAGDRLLKQIAERLLGSVRTSDHVFRYGGDEFAVLLPGTDAAGALVVAEKVLAGLEALPAAGRAPRVHASIGCASYPGDAHDAHELVASADTALYVAKETGKSRAVASGDLPRNLNEMRALLERILHEPLPRADGAVDMVQLLRPLHELLGGLAPRLAARDAAIAALCRRVGPYLGLRGEALGTVEAAALVANIGRLAAAEAPDEALDTLGLAHPVIAARLLEPYPILRGVADLVRHHHETWDGSGFPDGLKGAELTPGMCGLAAVSRYVELVSPADPALAPCSPAMALATLRDEAGNRLAPETVAQLVGALERDAAA
jgi:diguanylate cyclase (GGDEF)-like protein/excisionase family DNA binding protein